MRAFALMYDEFGNRIIHGDSVRRVMFTAPDGRIVGTEIVRHHVWQGRDRGYTWREETTATMVFRTKEEAGLWRRELDARIDILLAHGAGVV